MLYPETARFAGKRNRFFDDISGRQYETYRIGRLVRWHKGWKRNVDDGKRNLVEDTLFFFGTLQKCRGHQPGRIDCGSPCRLFHDGFIRTARSTWHEGRRNPDYGDTGNGQNGKRIFHHTYPSGRPCTYSRRRCGYLQDGSLSCERKLSCFACAQYRYFRSDDAGHDLRTKNGRAVFDTPGRFLFFGRGPRLSRGRRSAGAPCKFNRERRHAHKSTAIPFPKYVYVKGRVTCKRN